MPRDPDDPYVRAIRGGKVSAPLVGGCLWLLQHTLGTPWEISLDGAILFFEDYKAPPYYIDGMLTQLGHAGKLDAVVGVVVGDMAGCDWGDLPEASDWARSRSLEDVLEHHLEPLGVPVHLQAAPGARQAPGIASARGPLYARRRPALIDGGRAGIPNVDRGRHEMTRRWLKRC